MWNDPTYLQNCYLLRQNGFLTQWEVGSTVARGFADLGFEEFIVLPHGKLLSLYTGQASMLKEEEEVHLFFVPTVEELINELSRNNVAVTAMHPVSGGWKVESEKASAEQRKLSHALQELFFVIFNIDRGVAKRSLKVESAS